MAGMTGAGMLMVLGSGEPMVTSSVGVLAVLVAALGRTVPGAEGQDRAMGVGQHLNLDVAGEFLVVAATLMHIKSRMLLPADEEEGEEPV